MESKNVITNAIKFVWIYDKNWIFFSLLISVVFGFTPFASIWITKNMIDAISELIQGDTDKSLYFIFSLITLQFLLHVAVSVISKVQEYLNNKAESTLNYILKRKILEKSGQVPLVYFDDPSFHDHLFRARGDQGSRFLAPIRKILTIFENTISVISLLLYLFSVHWLLVVFCLVALIPLLLIKLKIGQGRFNFYRDHSHMTREIRYYESLFEDREKAKELRLFQLVHHFINQWSEKYLKNRALRLLLLKKQQIQNVGADAVSAFVFVATAGVIVWLIRLTKITVGDFIAITQAVQITQNGINQIATSLAEIHEEKLFIKDYYDFIGYEHPYIPKDKSDLSITYSLKKGISFNHVSFSYLNSDTRTLDNITFSIRPGEKVAIVGENGSGKTTLVKCLLGLYKVTSGSIIYDDIDINYIDKESLHRKITVLFQDFIQYPFSVKENIGLGKVEDINNTDKIMAIGMLTEVDKIVEKFGGDYDTKLGKLLYDGEDLSGGQWQRIALARALFRDGEIVIFDEPTASMDPYAEIKLFQDFSLLTKDKTTIFVTHRMASAKIADRILVMKHGKIVEMGNHQELMNLKQEYYRMYVAQLQWYSEDTEKLKETIKWKN